MTIEDRFWKKVDIQDEADCWLWTGCQYSGGYGRFLANKKIRVAHRFGWEMVYGLIPKRLKILHSCDKPLCCNPEHWSLGTQADNMADMVQKGRTSNGR